MELYFNRQILYCSPCPHSKVCCKHENGDLNVLYISYRTLVRPHFSNVTVQSIPNQAYIATPHL